VVQKELALTGVPVIREITQELTIVGTLAAGAGMRTTGCAGLATLTARSVKGGAGLFVVLPEAARCANEQLKRLQAVPEGHCEDAKSPKVVNMLLLRSKLLMMQMNS
jgi:hypothetical protein